MMWFKGLRLLFWSVYKCVFINAWHFNAPITLSKTCKSTNYVFWDSRYKRVTTIQSRAFCCIGLKKTTKKKHDKLNYSKDKSDHTIIWSYSIRRRRRQAKRETIHYELWVQWTTMGLVHPAAILVLITSWVGAFRAFATGSCGVMSYVW